MPDFIISIRRALPAILLVAAIPALVMAEKPAGKCEIEGCTLHINPARGYHRSLVRPQ